MLSVYSRHYPPCTSDDINYMRCRCPKWISGIAGFGRLIHSPERETRSWEKAKEFKRELEAEYESKQNGDSEPVAVTPEKVSVKDAVMRFLKSKRNENLADSTIDKLKTIFVFLVWQWFAQVNCRQLAAKFSPTLQDLRPSARGRNAKTLSSTNVPRHIRG